MRDLSLRQAANCEEAREPICRCRCGGALHGAKRGTGAIFFGSLPETDPHYIPTAEARAARKRAAREEAQKRRYEALASFYSGEGF